MANVQMIFDGIKAVSYLVPSSTKQEIYYAMKEMVDEANKARERAEDNLRVLHIKIDMVLAAVTATPDIEPLRGEEVLDVEPSTVNRNDEDFEDLRLLEGI